MRCKLVDAAAGVHPAARLGRAQRAVRHARQYRAGAFLCSHGTFGLVLAIFVSHVMAPIAKSPVEILEVLSARYPPAMAREQKQSQYNGDSEK